MLICSLFTTQLSLFILGQISAARSERWYRKLEFCFNSWWFYYHRLSWNSSHAMLALFFLYSFLVWIFSWRDLFQVTGTVRDLLKGYELRTNYAKSTTSVTFAYCAWFVALLSSPYPVLLRTCPYLLLTQFGSSVYIRIQFELR